MTSILKLSGAALVFATTAVHAQEPVEPLGSHQQHFSPSIGVRAGFIEDEGFDRFATNDVLTQLTVGFSRTLRVVGDLSVAGDLHWDYGGRSAQARGMPASLDVHRLSIGPELRFQPFFFAYGFGRISPALLNTSASLQDDISGVTLHARNWTYGLDATLGIAVQLYGDRSGASNKPRIWGSIEGGYGYGAPTKLSFVPDEEEKNEPLRLSSVELGELSVSGPLLRVAAAVSF